MIYVTLLRSVLLYVRERVYLSIRFEVQTYGHVYSTCKALVLRASTQRTHCGVCVWLTAGLSSLTWALIYQKFTEKVINPIVRIKFRKFVCMKKLGLINQFPLMNTGRLKSLCSCPLSHYYHTCMAINNHIWSQNIPFNAMGNVRMNLTNWK